MNVKLYYSKSISKFFFENSLKINTGLQRNFLRRVKIGVKNVKCDKNRVLSDRFEN